MTPSFAPPHPRTSSTPPPPTGQGKLGEACCVVRPLSAAETSPLATQLLQNLKGWDAPGERLDDEQVRWNDLCDDAFSIASIFQYCDDSKPSFVAEVGKAPVGLMRVGAKAGASSLDIRELVTHPGSGGVGWRLICQAVNESERMGLDGCVRVFASTARAEDAYEAMGFLRVRPGDSEMVLDPSTRTDLWHRSRDGRWRALRE